MMKVWRQARLWPGALGALWALAALVLTVAPLAAPAQSLQPVDDRVVAAHVLKAKQGDAREQFLVGLMYERGHGLPQDFAQAAYWYGEAAKQGQVQAQMGLGNLYDKGKGVPQSYENALGWYRQAAAQGDGQAMFFIGSMIYNGDGIKADHSQVAEWFQRSLNAGYGPAKEALARVRAELQGVAPPAPAPAPVLAKMEPKEKTPAPPLPSANPLLSSAPATGPDALKPGVPKTEAGRPADDTLPSGIYAVQVGAFDSREQAQGEWARIGLKLSDELAAQAALIYHKTMPDGRVVYRLNAGEFAQKAEAQDLCAQLKSNHVDCLVMRY